MFSKFKFSVSRVGFWLITLVLYGFVNGQEKSIEDSVANWRESLGAGARSYDEVLDPSTGELRAPFQWLAREYANVFPNPHPTVLTQMFNSPLNDRLQIAPVPLALTDDESKMIGQGTLQRAQALRELFYDLFIGEGRILSERKLFDADFVNRVLNVEETSLKAIRRIYAGKTKDDIRMNYSPDLVRAPNGRWMVMEDNIGNIGGLGDVWLMGVVLSAWKTLQNSEENAVSVSLDRLFAKLKELGEQTEPEISIINDPMFQSTLSFVESATQRGFIRRQSGKQTGILFDFGKNDLSIRKYQTTHDQDREDIRRTMLVLMTAAMLGFEPVRPNGPEELVEMLESGKFGALLNLSQEAADLELRSRYLDAFTNKGIIFFRSPYTEVIGNKAFLPFMDDIIRFYLKEEPLLPTIETQLILKVEDIPADYENWVFKKTDENQGNAVFVMPKILDSFHASALKFVRDTVLYGTEFSSDGEPLPVMIAQRYVKPSTLPLGGIHSWLRGSIDIRPFSYINGEKIEVSQKFWGRLVESHTALSNVSKSGSLLMVLIAPCEAALTTP